MRGEKMDLFNGGGDLQSVANEIYGGSPDIPDSGRVVARPTPISAIWADVKQPRRAIPINIRLHWDGNPANVRDLLTDWQRVAEKEAGMSIDVVGLLNGEGEGLDADNFPSVAQEYLALVRLAQGIKADGLINPITIIESDGKLLIESGERRWLAFHLLFMHLGEPWGKIPAAKGNVNDSVWRQASENTQRRQLNPIGMARQLALLIMAARGTPPMASGTQYVEYDEAVKNGASDRRFYAQVADGNIHRIPRGLGERIQAAMGLSMEQLARYRALLRLTDDELVNDALWTRADVENWAEGALREIATLPIGKVSTVVSRASWTLDDLKALKEMPVDRPPSTIGGQPFQQPQRPAAIPPARPIPGEWIGKHASTNSGITGKVVDVTGDWIQIIKDDNRQKKSYHFSGMYIIPTPDPQPTPNAGTNADPFTHKFAIGDTVRTRTGTVGEVVGISGRHVTVKTINGSMVHDWSLLVKIEKPAPPAPSVPQIREEDIEADVDPESTPHERPWSEGISIGHNNLDASDKVDSVPQYAFDIFNFASTETGILGSFSDIAEVTGEAQTVSMLDWIMEIKDLDAKALHEQGLLKAKLDDCYNVMGETMKRWLEVTFANILQQIETAAVN